MRRIHHDQAQGALIQAFSESQLRSDTKLVEPVLIYIKPCVSNKQGWGQAQISVVTQHI